MPKILEAVGRSQPFVKVQAPPIVAQRAPATTDTDYPKGATWLDESVSPGQFYTHLGGGDWDAGANSYATTSTPGIVELSTDAEALAEASTTVVLTPSNLAALGATTTFAGLAELATNAEAQAESSSSVVLTPSNYASIKAGTNITFRASPVLQSAATTGVAPTGSAGDVNIMVCEDGDIMEQFIMGTQTIIAPRMAASGLLISGDATDNDGFEYNWGPRANAKHVYTIGTSAAFFMEAKFVVADVSGADPLYIGFRKVEANNGTYTSYSDYAFIGLNATANAGTVIIDTELNGGGNTQTNTTDAWADGETHTLKVLVSAAGVVTYTIDGAAPTTTAAFTFDSADNVMPCIHFLQGTTAPGAVHLVELAVGLQ